MKIKNLGGSVALIELTADEVGIVNNALNEVCNGVDLRGEFHTRMGCTADQARRLLAGINQLGRSMKEASE
jgi:hypothetical protein